MMRLMRESLRIVDQVRVIRFMVGLLVVWV